MQEHADSARGIPSLRKAQEELHQEMRALADEAGGLTPEQGGQDIARYLALLELMGNRRVTHGDVTRVARNLRMDLEFSDSFWEKILQRRRKKQLGRVPEKHLGIDKQNDIEFVKSLGCRTVQKSHRGTLSSLPKDVAGTVVKPLQSSDSRGVFYVLDEGVFSVSESAYLPSAADLEARAADQVLPKAVDSMEWELQELVTLDGKPAPDVKFYTFYGEVGVILEVTRFPELSYSYFDESGKRIDLRPGQKPESSALEHTTLSRDSEGRPTFDEAREISLAIPVPFMRIDFLNSDEGLVFVEFSSAPGDSHALVREHDARLGRMHSLAEMRVIGDLLKGKSFEKFQEFDGAWS